jgi:hypothetical protein
MAQSRNFSLLAVFFSTIATVTTPVQLDNLTIQPKIISL